VLLEELGKLKISTSSGTRTGDLPACNIVSQPSTLPRAAHYGSNYMKFKKEIVKSKLLQKYFISVN
jgi:hypothetical protein